MASQQQLLDRSSSYTQALLALVLVCTLLCNSAAAAAVRGVDPAAAHLYAGTSKTFACRDGSKVVPFSHVNDDYCDCFDGSDEPGTSACANGVFYCANVGFESKVINASFVDDGVCDCCDGTDELQGCADNCIEQGLAALGSLRAALEAAEKGMQVKQQYIQQADGLLKGWQQELESLGPQIEEKQAATDALKAALDEAEAREKEQREKEEAERKAKEEAEKAAKEAAEAAAAAAGGAAPTGEQQGEAAAAAGDAPAAAGEAAGQGAAAGPAAADPQQQQAEAGGAEAAAAVAAAAADGSEGSAVDAGEAAAGGEEDADELGRKIASQWISGAHEATGGSTSDDAAADEQADSGDDLAADLPYEDYDHHGHYEPPADVPEGEQEQQRLVAPPKPGIVGLFKKFVGGLLGSQQEEDVKPRPASEIRTEWSASNRELTDLKNKRTDLEKKLAQDYGPEREFAAISYKCLDGQFDKYTYSVCLYEKAAQKEGGGSTSLGSWGGWEDGFGKATFTNGQHCWQGPNRSLKVTLECGAADEVLKVEEPSRCEYTAVLKTPAACHQSQVDALREELAAKEAAVRGAKQQPPAPAAGGAGEEEPPKDEL